MRVVPTTHELGKPNHDEGAAVRCKANYFIKDINMKQKKGRPSTYNKTIANEIVDAIACSPHGLRLLCKSHPHWPNPDTIFSWLKNNKDFADQYAQAKRYQADVLVDEMISIVNETSNDYRVDEMGKVVISTENIQRARLRIDLYKWIACKLIPKVYGDRIKYEAELTMKQEDAIRLLE